MSEAQVHKLKTVSRYWEAVRRGDKTFEVRLNDRAFQTGDILELVKVDDKGYYEDTWRDECHRVIRKRISYILQGGQFGIEARYCILGLSDAPN